MAAIDSFNEKNLSSYNEILEKAFSGSNVYRGRTKIKIPVSEQDFMENEEYYITKYLSGCLKIHKKNQTAYKYLNAVVDGFQDVLFSKTRPDGSDINNKSVENRLEEISSFWQGFLYGEKLDYSLLKSSDKDKDNDDMELWNKFLKLVKKYSLDLEKASNLVNLGIAYQMVIPLRASEFDEEEQAPYELFNVDPNDVFQVHSASVDNKSLFFCVLSSTEDGDDLYTVYTKSKTYILKEDKSSALVGSEYIIDFQEDNLIGDMYIQEFDLDCKRKGVIERVLDPQNLVNSIDSTQIDEYEQSVNSIVVFKNLGVEALEDSDEKTISKQIATFKQMLSERTLFVSDKDQERKAAVDILSQKIDNSQSNEFYQRKLKSMFEITATPRSISDTTSGGDTGIAKQMSNGWEAAQNRSKIYSGNLLGAEEELANKILKCCKLKTDKLNTLKISNINVRFNINLSNDIYTKMQAFLLSLKAGMPADIGLKLCLLTNDIQGVAKAIKDNIDNNPFVGTDESDSNDVSDGDPEETGDLSNNQFE